MSINPRLKKLMVAIAAVALVIGAFLAYSLAGLTASPVVFDAPPVFVERHATKMKHVEPATSTTESELESRQVNAGDSAKVTEDFSAEEALVNSVFFGEESPETILRLFRHSDKTQRVKMALAFSSVNLKFTHDEESGYPEKRKQFWADYEENIPDIRNALFEALIASAEEDTSNYIPYTVAWIPGQGQETVELLAWAAKHHPNWWVRSFSVYFVVEFGKNEELAGSLLASRTHDPDYRVRKQVLDLRIKRITG